MSRENEGSDIRNLKTVTNIQIPALYENLPGRQMETVVGEVSAELRVRSAQMLQGKPERKREETVWADSEV